MRNDDFGEIVHCHYVDKFECAVAHGRIYCLVPYMGCTVGLGTLILISERLAFLYF